MASFNKVILIGNLTRDPDLRTTQNGTAICDLGLAVNRRWRDQSGRDQEETTFVDVAVWGRSAENCAQYLQKGAPVLVDGRLRLEQWEDRNGGGKRSRLTVVAEMVQFLGSRADGERQEEPPQDGYRRDSGYSQPAARRQNSSRQGGRNDGGFGAPPPPQQPPYPPEDDPGYDPEDEIPF